MTKVGFPVGPTNGIVVVGAGFGAFFDTSVCKAARFLDTLVICWLTNLERNVEDDDDDDDDEVDYDDEEDGDVPLLPHMTVDKLDPHKSIGGSYRRQCNIPASCHRTSSSGLGN